MGHREDARAGHQPGQQAHGRAGGDAIERQGWLLPAVQPAAMNQQLVRAGLFDLDAETAHTLQGRQAVAPARKATHPADAIG